MRKQCGWVLLATGLFVLAPSTGFAQAAGRRGVDRLEDRRDRRDRREDRWDRRH